MKRKPICGIYKITSPSGKVYIGQSLDIYTRWTVYRRLKCMAQIKLYRSFIKHGIDNHVFEIISECTEPLLNSLEVYYERLYDSTNTKAGLNVRGCGNKGKMAEESKRKISRAHFGIKPSEATKQKLRKSSTGNKNSVGLIRSEETKAKISLKLLGTKRPTEAIVNAINGRKGYKHKEETIKKIKESNIGVKRSEEARINISVGHIGLEQSSETINKRATALKKIILNKESGIFYFGMQEVCDVFGINKSSLSAKLNGYKKNNTPFIYA